MRCTVCAVPRATVMAWPPPGKVERSTRSVAPVVCSTTRPGPSVSFAPCAEALSYVWGPHASAPAGWNT